jgi:transposase-like protein
MNRPSYAELLEAQLADAPSHVTEQQQIQRLEAELTELRRRLQIERSVLTVVREAS